MISKRFCVVALLATALALGSAQSSSNSTVTAPIILLSPLESEIASCAQRDQIQWLNQLLAVEYVSQAYFSQLNSNMDSVNSSWTTADVGISSGHNVGDVKSNITLIINQLNSVVSWLNSTVTSYCSGLSSDDQEECYAFVRCNYTFGNLTNWPNVSSTPQPTPVPTSAPSNHSGNSTTNSTASGNSTVPVTPITNSTASNETLSTAVPRALQQGVDLSDRDVQFIISLIPLVSNSTIQQQLAEFAVLHGQHASYLRGVWSGRTEFVMPPVLGSSNVLSRTSIRSGLLPWVADQDCCDGFRGLQRV